MEGGWRGCGVAAIGGEEEEEWVQKKRFWSGGGDMERGMGTVGCVLVEWGVKGLEKGVQVERLWGYKESSNWNPT